MRRERWGWQGQELREDLGGDDKDDKDRRLTGRLKKFVKVSSFLWLLLSLTSPSEQMQTWSLSQAES